MPTIESRKTGEVQYIDMNTYKNLKRTGLIRRFVIIDDSDLEPVEVIKSKKLLEFEKPDSSLKPREIIAREDLEKMTKEELEDEFGVSSKLYKTVMIDEILKPKDEKQEID